MDKETNNLYYVCSLIEFIGRMTKNRNNKIVEILGKDELKRQLYLAEVNHCLSFEQVASELVDEFEIKESDFDSVGRCRYKIPSYTSIGGVYRDLILDVMKQGKGKQSIVDIMYEVFTSFISDEISDFNTSTYYENPSYIYHSYRMGELLD